MRSGFLALVLLAATVGGCVPTPYVRADYARFRSAASPQVLFPWLVRASSQMGYLLYAADPGTGIFEVYARSTGRRSRRGRVDPMRSDLLVVHVEADEVRITAIGRHVQPDGLMHPRLAQEATMFAEALQSVARDLPPELSSGVVPSPPTAYGALAPSSAPQVGGSLLVPAPLPPGAYGAPVMPPAGPPEAAPNLPAGAPPPIAPEAAPNIPAAGPPPIAPAAAPPSVAPGGPPIAPAAAPPSGAPPSSAPSPTPAERLGAP